MDAASQVRAFGATFSAAGDEARARGEKAYLKSPLAFHGVPVPLIRRTARDFFRSHGDLQRVQLIRLVDRLWRSGYHDLRSLGIALLEQYDELLGVRDLALIEGLLRQSSTWDHVDWLSTRVAGSMVRRYRSARRTLERWSRDESFWIRRAAMLALLGVLRTDDRDFVLFERFAARMIDEREFFIRKAIGWVLREVSKRNPDPVDRFLDRHIARVSGLTLREGSKYLPPKRREALLAAHRAQRKRRVDVSSSPQRTQRSSRRRSGRSR